MPDETRNDLGPLAVALAKAQSEFGPITRSKKVTVKTKTGGSYDFSYAPLDQILAQTMPALASNGLTITQLLDTEGLATMLLHESGAFLQGRTPLPDTTDIQAFGSAITYLRRYAIQALLGIAAEEDDDGNRATGNAVQQRQRAPRGAEPRGMTREEATALANATEPVLEGLYAGTGEIRFNPTPPADGNMRDTPDGPLLAFQFFAAPEQGERQGRKIPQVFVHGPLAVDLIDTTGADLRGLVCAVEGDLYRVPWFKDAKPMPPFQRLELHHIDAAGWSLPLPAETTGDPRRGRRVATPDAAGVPSEEPAVVPPAPSLPMFDEATEAELDEALR